MAKKKQLVYKSKHGDIPVLIRDYVPDGELWFMSDDAPMDIFDNGITVADINTEKIYKRKFITQFKKRRFGKMKDI